MDIWSKLIAGSFIRPAAKPKATPSNNPDKRLTRLKREYHQLLQIWRNAPNLSQDEGAIENVRRTIQELTSILSDENTRPSPHPCISFASSKQIYVTVGKIATTSYDESIVEGAVTLFKKLIECDEEDFLEDGSFSRSLTNFLQRITGANSISLSQETQVKVIELAFNIAAKIKLQPEILPAWFTIQKKDANPQCKDDHEKFAGRTHKEDFPLFYLLIDNIHEDGPTGEFARTGLLYIIESAITSTVLEEWLVESDLATLMATGLGALYGRLSRKLVIDYFPDQLPPILALSDYQHPVTTADVVSSTDSEFHAHMDTFLSHLLFWQDVLKHCQSVEVSQTLLEHFRVCFLQQILYPSLLQSSDVDGGSSVAVLTSLRRILESLDHPDMIHLILHYLLALPDDMSVSDMSASMTISAARKRKSMDLANMMASQTEDEANPALFNLVDLILSCLRSKSQQTIGVTLHLVSIILRQHHRYAVSTLLRTHRTSSCEQQRTIGAHSRELEFILSLADEINADENLEESYENLLKDSLVLLESHLCSQGLINPQAAINAPKLRVPEALITGAPKDVTQHTLRPDDPMLQIVLKMLETFYVNPVEINLKLTETLIDLASCGFMGLEGWFLPDPSKYSYQDSDEGEMVESTTKDDESFSETHERNQRRAFLLARRTPKWPPSEMPAFLSVLQTLISHVSTYRSEIPRFDDLLQQRRQAFYNHSEQTAQAQIVRPHPRASFDSSPSRSASPPPAKLSTLDSLAQRIFPEFATPSRSSSPRGRRSQDQQRGSSSYGSPTPIANAQMTTPRIPPPQFPMNSVFETPARRRGSRAFSSSPLRGSEPPTRVPKAVASQVAAFVEVDRAILARKVGIPTTKGELVPSPFPNLSKATGKLDHESNVTRGTETSEETGSASGYETAGSHIASADDEDEAQKGKNGVKEENGKEGVGHVDQRDGESEMEMEVDEQQEEAQDGDDGEEEEKLVTVSHVLTNVIVLQEFLLELAALVQVRAGLFGEVKWT